MGATVGGAVGCVVGGAVGCVVGWALVVVAVVGLAAGDAVGAPVVHAAATTTTASNTSLVTIYLPLPIMTAGLAGSPGARPRGQMLVHAPPLVTTADTVVRRPSFAVARNTAR